MRPAVKTKISGIIKRLTKFKRAALLLSTLTSCTIAQNYTNKTKTHEEYAVGSLRVPLKVPKKQLSRRIMKGGLIDSEILAGEPIEAVLFSDGKNIKGTVLLKTNNISSEGVLFDFILIEKDFTLETSFRVNFDGSKSGDLRAIRFFGKDIFKVEKQQETIHVIYKKTIAHGYEELFEKPQCPTIKNVFMACT